MALTKQIEMVSNFGDMVVFNNAYFKVSQLNVTKNNVSIFLEVLKDKEGLVINSFWYSFVPKLDGDNFIKQAYLYLKTLPEYVDAADC